MKIRKLLPLALFLLVASSLILESGAVRAVRPLAGSPAVKLRASSSDWQTVPNTGPITMRATLEEFDEFNMHDPAVPECLTAGNNGDYLVGASLVWSLETGGSRGLFLYVRRLGTFDFVLTSRRSHPVQDIQNHQDGPTTLARLQAGDCVYVVATQTSSRAVSALLYEFWMIEQ